MLNLFMYRLLTTLLVLTSRLSGTRLWRIPCAIDNATDRFLTHEVAQRVGIVCWTCMELAPEWWEFDLDCAGHRCGQCDVCLNKAGFCGCTGDETCDACTKPRSITPDCECFPEGRDNCFVHSHLAGL